MAKKDMIENEIIRFHPNYQEGLKAEEVLSRHEMNLDNHLKKKTSKTFISIILGNIFTFFNVLYMIVFFLIYSTHTENITNYLFVLVVLANMLIGIIQELRSKATIDKLSLLSASKTTVIRDSNKSEVAHDELVLDDIIYLSSGKEIATDSILIDGEVEVNESQLTGESIPIRKAVGDMLYSGSFVISGNCHAQVEHVGKDNEIEKLSNMAKTYSKPKSEILGSLKKLLRFVAIIIVPFGLIMFVKSQGFDPYQVSSPKSWIVDLCDFVVKQFNLIRAEGVTSNTADSILSTSGSLLGMIPSGLFLLTSIALAVGVIRLAKQKTLVQNIYCIEMLARVDVLCLDKTGTITDGTMTVTRFIESKRNSDFNVNDIVSSMNMALQETNSTSKALENYFGFSSKYKVKDIYPFSSDTKYSAVCFEKEGTFILGAPEFVLKSNYEHIASTVNDYANQGLRVLALAYSATPLKDGKVQRVPKLVALILIEDQIRREAYDTIKYFRENNVEVKVISGDNPVTVSEVARRVGVSNAENYISLDNLTDEEVYQVANEYTVFGRVKPHQKKILVKALKAAKHTVAMTGDGVNDILALKEADCSIAMATGCDAVRKVSQLVLLDSNFASMPKVVSEGRRVINNIQKTSMLFLTKTIFTIILSSLFIFGFIGKFSGTSFYPFQPRHLLMIEFFAIGAPSFFLALQPNKNIIRGSFLPNVIRRSLPGALTVAIHVIITYSLARTLGLSNEQNVTIIVLTTTSTCLMILNIACRPYSFKKGLLFIAMLASCIFITLASMYCSPSQAGYGEGVYEDVNNEEAKTINVLGVDVNFYKLFGLVKLWEPMQDFETIPYVKGDTWWVNTKDYYSSTDPESYTWKTNDTGILVMMEDDGNSNPTKEEIEEDKDFDGSGYKWIIEGQETIFDVYRNDRVSYNGLLLTIALISLTYTIIFFVNNVIEFIINPKYRESNIKTITNSIRPNEDNEEKDMDEMQMINRKIDL